MASSHAPATKRRHAAIAGLTNAKRFGTPEKVDEAKRDLVAIQVSEFVQARMADTPLPLTRAQVTEITTMIKRA